MNRNETLTHDRDIPSIDPLISQLYELADRLGGDDGWLVCEAIGRIESGGAK